jgi:hypothetical protein
VISMTSMSICRFGGKRRVMYICLFGRFNAYQKKICIDLQLDDVKTN